MIQLYAYDSLGNRQELDLYGDDPILLNLSIEDITNLNNTNSSFSRNFRIPASTRNSKFFKWWYTAGAIDFDVTKTVTAEIHIDGLLWQTGQIRLQSVYMNGQTNMIDIEVAFLGPTKQFSTLLGDSYINELNVQETDHILSHTFMHDSQKAFTDPALPFGGKIRYAIGIRGYTYDEDGNILQNGQITFDNTRHKSFTSQPTHIETDQYVPFIQIKYLIDKIFEETNYTYSSDSVFNEEWWKFLYMDGIATIQTETPSNNSDVTVGVSTPYQIGTSLEERVSYDTVTLNNGGAWDPQNNQYVVGVTGSYTINTVTQIVDQVPFDGGSAGTYTFRLYRNGALVGVPTVLSGSGTPGQQFVLTANKSFGPATANTGDVFYVTVETSGGAENPAITTDTTFTAINTPATVKTSDLLKTDYKKVDFFKDILTRFRLVMSPSKVKPNEFVIKPWVSYIANGELFDWTDKLDNTKDIILKPVFFEQSSIVEFKDQEAFDQINTKHQETVEKVYGYRKFDSGNQMLSSTREVTTNMAPTPVTQAPGFEKHLATSSFIVPYFAAIQEALDFDGYPQLAPTIPKPRLLFWNGMQPCSTDNTHYYYDLTAPGVKHYDYPCMSYLSVLDSTANTLDLNWMKDIQYFEQLPPLTPPGTPSGQNGFDIYQRFWKQYIDTLYSKDARMLTAYFVLDPQDITNLTFDDIIWIKDSYWRLQRLVDAPLSGISSVKAELIKSVGYPQAGYSTLPIETAEGGTSGGGTPTYYTARNCEDSLDILRVYYPSALPLGKVITTTGSGNLGKCFELIAVVEPGPYYPILDIYDDCLDCQNAQ